MNATIRQQRALAARREQYSTAGQCRAIERKWSHTPVEGDGQMEMSDNAGLVREIRIFRAAVYCTAIALAATASWAVTVYVIPVVREWLA